eukprot:6207006-Pleurochrysis_carterae.AAC.1
MPPARSALHAQIESLLFALPALLQPCRCVGYGGARHADQTRLGRVLGVNRAEPGHGESGC